MCGDLRFDPTDSISGGAYCGINEVPRSRVDTYPPVRNWVPPKVQDWRRLITHTDFIIFFSWRVLSRKVAIFKIAFGIALCEKSTFSTDLDN